MESRSQLIEQTLEMLGMTDAEMEIHIACLHKGQFSPWCTTLHLACFGDVTKDVQLPSLVQPSRNGISDHISSCVFLGYGYLS